MVEHHAAVGLGGKGAPPVSNCENEDQHQMQANIAASQHGHIVGNKEPDVMKNDAGVDQEEPNVDDQDSEEEDQEVGIHPSLPQDILTVDTMSREELIAALEVLYDANNSNLPSEAVCIDVEIVEAIVAATATFLHHTHTQCSRIDASTGQRCTDHA
ncbi:hypothetical protein QBC45DRAFT_437225 [Copromyces sp. CBS 386.78]|nr:hypothetical protein QBC45DRAFT_437225 [Copromyces sp. CBS 386.78]